MEDKSAGSIVCYNDGKRLVEDFKVEMWLLTKAVQEQIQNLIDQRKEELAFLERCKAELEQKPTEDKLTIKYHPSCDKPFSVVCMKDQGAEKGSFVTRSEAEAFIYRQEHPEEDCCKEVSNAIS